MLRLQTPDGETKTLEPDSTWTLADLRQAAATVCGLSVAQVELRAGFPPQPLSGEDSALVTSVLGAGGSRVMVRRAGAAPAQAHNPHGSGGRKKAQPQRLAEGALPPRDVAPAESATKSDFAERMSEAKKRKREAQGATVPRATGGGGRINPNADPLALTMAQARGSSGGGGGGSSGNGAGSSAAEKVKVKTRTAEQLANEIYSGSGGALQSAARGGGKTGDFLSEHAMIEHRTSALSKRAYELAVLPKPTPKACEQLSATFKGTRKQLCEIVQVCTAACPCAHVPMRPCAFLHPTPYPLSPTSYLLPPTSYLLPPTSYLLPPTSYALPILPPSQLLRREDIKHVIKALSSKGSSSRGGTASHLLTPSALAARSPAVFWSLAHEFEGDFAAGVEELQVEIASEEEA